MKVKPRVERPGPSDTFVEQGLALIRDRCTLEPGATVTGDDFSLTLEPVVRRA